MTRGRKDLGVGAALFGAAAAVTLGQLHIVAEPGWLQRMNEFEHLVLHATFVLAGMALGSVALAVLVWSAVKLSPPLRRLIAQASHRPDRPRLRSLDLALAALVLLAATVTLLAAQHGGLPEPTWLARITPFQHFLIHIGYILSGVLIAAAGLLASGRSLLALLRPNEPSPRNGEGRAQRGRRTTPGALTRS
jgi:hypothetical protein